MAEHKPLRLTRFVVRKLFDEFDHDITFSDEGHVTALIGPNGIGKTVCLKLINSLFSNNWSFFHATTFLDVKFYFNDGSVVVVDKLINSDSDATDVSDALGIRFITSFKKDDGEEIWTPRSYDNVSVGSRSIENFLPFLTRMSPKTWIHDRSREVLTLQDILENYSDRIPESVKRSLVDRPTGRLLKICESIDCHLIETQRLLVLSEDDYRGLYAGSTLTISKKAVILKNIIARELASYASISQSLDRSFPKRVLEQGDITPSQELTDNLAKLDALRKELMDVGILDPESDDALPRFDKINESIAAVLNVYVRDTRDKLNVLDKIKNRIKLFKELMDNRLNPKCIVVDKKNGFVVSRSGTSDIPLEKLSSGEQHQLVMFFELLFELKKNALILIDEPELSLHVAWQKKFIPDLCKIIELNQFDVLLATHSPQLIGEWEDVVVELGDVD
ncbi:AAA family ATPase [Acetobacter estunensis]|uniref:AAA family ATPase n=1 Tax=Acetobacter estunensis TaxID=104097 RepID=UPI001C2D3020|nr:AAA family ATPase [Acetobacter estunensis]